MELQEIQNIVAPKRTNRLEIKSVLSGQSEQVMQLGQMKSRIEECLGSPDIVEMVKNDYMFIFRLLGLDESRAEKLWSEVNSMLLQDFDIKTIEKQIYEKFNNTNADNKNLPTIWNLRMAVRAKLIYRHIAPHFSGINGKVLDYGAGDGRIAQLLKDRSGLDIRGIDQCDYRAHNIGVPFHILDGKKTGFQDDEFEAAIMTNVAHHDQNNEGVLNELSRIVQSRLVVMETVPEGNTEEEIEQDKERMFMNDYLFNRLLPNADVPIPGAYKTPEEWKECFKRYGWNCTHEDELLGFATVMRDAHHLFVFER